MKKILIIIFLIIIIFIINDNKSTDIVIPNDSIRIRVIANSNSIEDQNLKKKVKKELSKSLSVLLKDANNIEDVREILNENLKGIKFTVNKVLESNNQNVISDVKYGLNYFPDKIYKGVKYNEGYYESIVVTIGSGDGDNWWCILFPPLCQLEVNNDNIEKVEYKSFIKEIINKYL